MPSCSCKLNTGTRLSRKHQQGITLIEVMISLFIFAMMGLMFSAVVPTAVRSARFSGSYSHAMTLCNRKMDQLLETGFSKLDQTNLKSLGVIDSTTPITSTNSYGTTSTYSFTNNTTAANANNPDNLLTYFPAGATGTIRIEPWVPGMWTLNGVSQPQLMEATVTVTWRDGGGAQSSYSMSSLIPRMTVN